MSILLIIVLTMFLLLHERCISKNILYVIKKERAACEVGQVKLEKKGFFTALKKTAKSDSFLQHLNQNTLQDKQTLIKKKL